MPVRHWPPGSGKRGGQFMPRDADADAAQVEPPSRGPTRGRRPTQPARPEPAPAAGWASVRERLSAATVDQLTDAFAEISRGQAGPAMDRALAELDAELARREGTSSLTVRDDPHSRQIDELLGRGWSYTQAYAEVHHLDPAKLDREERLALVDANRRKGERRRDTLRRMFAEHVYVQWLDAEQQTRGNLLSPAGRAAGVDPVSLWSGTAARARKYASEELKRWWEEHGGRHPFAVWSAEYTGDGTRARREHAGRGAGRDFGV